MHYTGQLLSGELEKAKEKEKEIGKRWKGRGKEGERWDRIVLGEGEGVQRVSGECGNLQQQQYPSPPPLYPPSHPSTIQQEAAENCSFC